MSFLTEKEIQKQLADDEQRWHNTIYDGFVPKLFMQYFKKALMAIPVAQHKYATHFLAKLISKRDDEINNFEIGCMINLIYCAPFQNMYDNIEQALEITAEFDKIREEYNQRTQAIEQSLTKKRNSLYKLSGLGANTASMKIAES